MKVLFLVYEAENHGGNYLRAFAYARGLEKAGCDVSIISARRKPGLRRIVTRVDNVTLIQFPDIFPKSTRIAGFSLMDCFFRVIHLLKHDYDIVHTFSHRPSVSIPAIFNRAIKGTPIISDWADLWGKNGIYDLRSPLERFLIGRFDNYWERSYRQLVNGITAITTLLRDYSTTISKLPAEKILLLPVGASFDLVEIFSMDQARKKFNLPSDKTILVFTSLNEYDTSYLIDVFFRIAKRSKDVMLLMAGVMSSELLSRVEQEGLKEQVRYMGIIEPQAAREIIFCGDAVVVPYRNNELNRARFPNRFSDCISAGRAIITNKTGDLAQVIETERIGMALDENPEVFASDIISILNDREQLKVMGHRARELSCKDYSIYKLADALKGYYKQFI